MEIQANEDIIKTMIRSGVPDMPLPLEIELQITVDKSKTGTQATTKETRMARKQVKEQHSQEEKEQPILVERRSYPKRRRMRTIK